MTSAQHHWGTFAGNRKKGKTTQYCAVGKHSPTAYFSLVPAPLESHFRNPHPGPPLCCEACWQKKCVLPLDTRRSRRTPPFDEDTPSSQLCSSSQMPSGSQSSQRPPPSSDALCELCGRFAVSHTFDSTDLAFRLASCSVRQISHKSSLLVCEYCRKHLSGASTHLLKVRAKFVLLVGEPPGVVHEAVGPDVPGTADAASLTDLQCWPTKGTIPCDVRVKLAEMQVDCGASANCAANSYHLLLGGKCHCDSAQHALMELDSVLFDCMCIELAEVQEVALGCDGTTTWYSRSAFEVHLAYKRRVELANLTDITEKDAAGYLRKGVEFWDHLNVRQEELSLQPTSIYWCMSVICDNTSVNTGHVKGLVALLERVREHAYAKGCDGHIAGIIYTTFDRALVQYFANDLAMSYLRHPKKIGKSSKVCRLSLSALS